MVRAELVHLITRQWSGTACHSITLVLV